MKAPKSATYERSKSKLEMKVQYRVLPRSSPCTLLSKLPEELQMAIFENCDKDFLKALRHVCRREAAQGWSGGFENLSLHAFLGGPALHVATHCLQHFTLPYPLVSLGQSTHTATKPSKIKSLSLINIPMSCNYETALPQISSALAAISELTLSFLESAPQNNPTSEDMDQPSGPEAVVSRLPTTWLSHNLSNLTKLDLGYDTPVGVSPQPNFGSLYLEKLREVGFHNHLFSDDHQIDWITKHKTLVVVDPADSSIVLFASTKMVMDNWRDLLPISSRQRVMRCWSTRWCHICNRLYMELPLLRQCVVGKKLPIPATTSNYKRDGWAISEGIHRSRYMQYRYGYIAEFGNPAIFDCETDAGALAQVHDKIGNWRAAKKLKEKFKDNMVFWGIYRGEILVEDRVVVTAPLS
ncbi:hypothetical protein K505DRAFT_337882 [Melanomma pulvis-pyrius CBS 109.77]|uniref:F-box domain-containing protein n=1 Tax=Melanomma pulvis-pyrius CBS 109.77 TaxID=1314802 RepID=A0A6A6XAA7_9PLEO|nr:hypothetical protein K505DRAFT_337882 [Melanomma pulvis-pyrius CBS 109.77]